MDSAAFVELIQAEGDILNSLSGGDEGAAVEQLRAHINAAGVPVEAFIGYVGEITASYLNDMGDVEMELRGWLLVSGLFSRMFISAFLLGVRVGKSDA